MTFQNHLVVGLLVALGLTLVSGSKEVNCDQLLINSDLCLRKATFILDKAYKTPRTMQQMDVSCAEARKAIVCVKKFGKCLRLLPKTIFGTIFSKVRGVYKTFCQTEEGKKVALQHLGCVNEERITLLTKFLNKATIYMDYVAKNVSTDEVIPWMCCAYGSLFKESQSWPWLECNNLSTEERKKFLLGLISSVAAESLNLACGRFSTAESCEVHLKRSIVTFKELTTPESKVTPQKYTPFVPAIEIAQRLDVIV